MKTSLALVGIGKIARDQHLPTLARNDAFELVATASRHERVDGVPGFESLAALLAARPEVEAVSLCTPPASRYGDAALALREGKHVLLEKPPGATLSEVEHLIALAGSRHAALHASWHSRHAPGVAIARDWLRSATVTAVYIAWKENVRQWHPGQDWIWEPGGLGVFDPAINALSIATEILPEPFALRRGKLDFPANRQTPVRASLAFETASGAPVTGSFDFLQEGEQTWDIRVETQQGPLLLGAGGSTLRIDGVEQTLPPEAEYAGVYARFAAAVAARAVDVDLAPLRHVADAFMLGERAIIEPFEW